MRKRLHISVTGIVQGVGFRPFVYLLADRLHLSGWVYNAAGSVEIEVEGREEEVEALPALLREQAPPLASVHGIVCQRVPLEGKDGFFIRDSLPASLEAILVSPDMAICPSCLKEMQDYTDRRYRYPFINCTHCGPRYSIIKNMPYDRAGTTMAKFALCPECACEYHSPMDRRFHAQPNACAICGPSYQFYDQDWQPKEGDSLLQTACLIRQGGIVAIQGIGGYHLACDARNAGAVMTLRQRKGREEKPLAVMAGSSLIAQKEGQFSQAEQDLLESQARPIVLVQKGEKYSLAATVAPSNPYIGIMLPYAPLHYLLMDADEVWVMTSANPSEVPMVCSEEEARKQLTGIADAFLTHNRPIYRRVDDSVCLVFEDKPLFVRRSRGYVPAPLFLHRETESVLAVGGDLKNTFCFTRGRQALLGPHLGDLAHAAAYNNFKEEIEHFKKLFSLRPTAIAHDLHPDYFSTRYAKEQELPMVAIQHHHAHAAAVMAEHGLTGAVLAVVFDGTGLGEDGCLWGGEFLVTEYSQYERAAHIAYRPLPSGEKAIQQPWRQALWMLHHLRGEEGFQLPLPWLAFLPDGWEWLLQGAAKGINSPLTSSAGRLFDTAAALCGIGGQISYEGQAAIAWQMAAEGRTDGQIWPYEIQEGSSLQLDFVPLFEELLQQITGGTEIGFCAASFHRTLAVAVTDVLQRLRAKTGIKEVVLAGGVFQNRLLLTQVMPLLRREGFSIFLPQALPPGDGSISLGQAMIAVERRGL